LQILRQGPAAAMALAPQTRNFPGCRGAHPQAALIVRLIGCHRVFLSISGVDGQSLTSDSGCRSAEMKDTHLKKAIERSRINPNSKHLSREDWKRLKAAIRTA
jgi:hypothetical protein